MRLWLILRLAGIRLESSPAMPRVRAALRGIDRDAILGGGIVTQAQSPQFTPDGLFGPNSRVAPPRSRPL